MSKETPTSTSLSDSASSDIGLLGNSSSPQENNMHGLSYNTVSDHNMSSTTHSQDSSDDEYLPEEAQTSTSRYHRAFIHIRSLTKSTTHRAMFSFSALMILGTALIISLLTVFTFITRPHSSYSVASHNFISENPILSDDGKPIDGLSRWLKDFSRSVVPIMCHSHNDYWRPYPLFSALAAGCTGIEADVWLAEDGETLLVGHDRASLHPDRTLESMYLDPLFDILERHNPAEQWRNNTVYDRARGVFQTQPNTTLVLMIDVKTDALQTWNVVLSKLARFRATEKRYLTRYEQVFPAPGFVERQEIWPSAVTVVASGNANISTIPACYPDMVPIDPITHEGGHSTYYRYHDTFLDAPLQLLPTVNKFSYYPGGSSSSMQYHPSNSYYASVSFNQAIGSVRTGFSDAQMATLREQISIARKSGLVTRYWDLPSWPINYRDFIWQTLTDEGVGMLSVDDLEAAARRGWTEGYIRDVVWIIVVSVWIFVCSVAALWFAWRAIRTWRAQARQDIYLE